MRIKTRNEATGEIVEINVDGCDSVMTKEDMEKMAYDLDTKRRARLVSGEKEYPLPKEWEDKTGNTKSNLRQERYEK